jgi:hypothetical protein
MLREEAPPLMTHAPRRRPVTARPLLLATTALALSVPATAFGQQAGPYAPLGIRAGSFLIYPTFSVSEAYDDNIRATHNNTESDFITLLQPQIRAQSNFSRHALALAAGSNIGLYADHSSTEDFQDFFVNGSGRLDITGQSNLTGTASVARAHQARDSPEDNPDQSLTKLYNYDSGLSYYQAFNRLNFRVGGNFARADYTNNDQGDRDQNAYTGTLRTGYLVSPRINTFVQGSYTVTNRDQRVDNSGIERDTKSWAATTGAELNFTDLIIGDFFFGYTRETFAEGDFNDSSGLAYGLDLTWTPTLLTTVTLSGAGGFQPTNQSDASSNLEHTLTLRVDHELLRNVLIGGNLGYVRDDFTDGGRTDNQVNTGLNASYLLNRNFSLDANYEFSNRWSDLSSEEFTRNVIRLGVTARL